MSKFISGVRDLYSSGCQKILMAWNSTVEFSTTPAKLRNLIFFALVVYPFLVWYGSDFFFQEMTNCKIFENFSLAFVDRNLEIMKTINSQHIWSASVLLLMTICVWVIVFSWVLILKTELKFLIIPILILIVILSAVIVEEIFFKSNGFLYCAGETMFNTIKDLEFTLRDSEFTHSDPFEVHLIEETLVYCQAVVSVTILHVAVATSSVLVRGDAPVNWHDLQDRAARLKSLLYVTALGLVVVYLSIEALFDIPQAMLPEDVDGHPHPKVQEFADLAEGLKVFLGTTFTLVLLAAFVPAFAILRRRSIELAKTTVTEDGTEPADPEKEAQRHGLVDDWKAMALKLLAILAPVLSGPLAELLRSLPDL